MGPRVRGDDGSGCPSRGPLKPYLAALDDAWRREPTAVRADPASQKMNCVVIPAYRAAASILDVIARVGPEIELIVVVDDCCPEGTGVTVSHRCNDPRVVVLVHDVNQGVGG